MWRKLLRIVMKNKEIFLKNMILVDVVMLKVRNRIIYRINR